MLLGRPRTGATKEGLLPRAARRSYRLAKVQWGIVWIALLAGLFYHILRSVDPLLLYYGDLVSVPSNSLLTLPLFERGWAFFASLAGLPGGPTEWAGNVIAARPGQPG